MAANDYLGVLTLVGQQKLAAAIGGTPLVLQTIRVGDGNGAEITPNETMIDLVHRVGNAYGVVSSGRDPVNLQMWRVTAVIPETDGPFNIREIGVFDADGDLIAIARHPLVEKRAPGQGAAVELTTDIVFPVSSTAQITVNFLQDSGVDIARLMRPPFIAVNSATLKTPPATPVQGDLYLVPAAPTGAWSGSVGKLMMWNGIVWRMATAPTGSVVCASDTGIYWRKTASGWTEWHATTDDKGLIELATNTEVQEGTDKERAVTPSGLSSRVATIDRAGLIKLATATDIQQGQDTEKAITPAGLASVTSTLLMLLTSDLDVWVRPDGNDANDGTANTPAKAFKTIQGAWNAIAIRYAASPVYAINIRLGVAGTYQGSFSIGPYGGRMRIIGNAANPSAYVINMVSGSSQGTNTFFTGSVVAELIGVTVNVNESNKSGITVQTYASLTVNNCNLHCLLAPGSTLYGMIGATLSGSIFLRGTININLYSIKTLASILGVAGGSQLEIGYPTTAATVNIQNTAANESLFYVDGARVGMYATGSTINGSSLGAGFKAGTVTNLSGFAQSGNPLPGAPLVASNYSIITGAV